MIIRPMVPADQDVLWDLLHVALWDPPPAGLRPRAILESAGVQIYAQEWGRPTDVGVIGTIDGEVAGACWMRLVPGGAGLAHVDDATPQLGIALFAQFQHQGHGERLMRAALDAARAHGYRQVSLTVHPQNPAIALYERCGFVKRELRNTYHLMVAAL
jgi:ribosomal protein S18 acetylase RimI-like enzyme